MRKIRECPSRIILLFVQSPINNHDEIIYDIDVGYEPYNEVKTAAIKELTKVYDDSLNIPLNTRREIISELSTSKYKWSPSMDDELESKLNSEDERKLAIFLLGKLIFSGYAQQMEGEHLIQPKASRLFLALSLEAESADHKLEKALFEELKNRANSGCEDLPWLPTFFPYLLNKADTPTELLKEAVKLRRSKEIADYRQWLREVMQDWKSNGKVSVQKQRDVRSIEQSVNRVLGIEPLMPEVKIKATVTNVLKPSGSIDFSPTIQGLWGWILGSLPGKRYRKLLTRAIIADKEYILIEKRVKSVWKG